MANVTMIFDAETAKAVQGFIKLENRTAALERKSKKLANTSSRGAKRAARSSSQWGSSITGLATQYIGLTAAIGGTVKVFADLNQERKRAAQGLISTMSSKGYLAQLAGGDKKLYDSYLKRAEALTPYGYTPTQAEGTIAAMVNAGMGPKQDRLAGRLYGITQDPRAIISTAGKWREAFGPEEAGSPRSIVGKIFTASKHSPFNATELAAGALRGAKLAAAAGASDEEYLAASVSHGAALKNQEEATTQIMGFLRASMKMGSKEKGIMNRVKEVESFRWTPKKAIKELTAEGYQGYLALRDQRAKIEQLEPKLRAAERSAGKGDIIDKIKDSYIERFPNANAAIQAKSRHQQMEQNTLASEELRRQAAIDDAQTGALHRGEGGYSRWKRRAASNVVSFFGGSPEAIDRAGQMFAGPMLHAPDRGTPAAQAADAIHVIIDDDKTERERGNRPDRNAGTE